ncbi:hypothetical protein K450DRAFT_217848 [Umbelopsis ramanniana AG]|uniref:RNA-binding protein 48 n=1 Tax=Umbelopsis ramanniana AG TaxID=1314678 RepID=A0AAD5EJQ4_UMBRA|nr:uncharacterized protein K450DRAFT_217848 [Umbelopsis ramanniana AG]KAI8584752.1 hypothetical protein K450DRAFT_217848 [Umbelopsis ramanniana AG]
MLPTSHTKPTMEQWTVYTILQESFYLIIEQVPPYHLENEIVRQCSMLGKVLEHSQLHDHANASDLYNVFLIKLDTIASARKVKRKLDDTVFYGGQIRVYYAPERESVQDTRRKLNERQMAVHHHLNRRPTSRGSSLQNLSSETTENHDRMPTSLIGPQVYPSSQYAVPMEMKKRRRRI